MKIITIDQLIHELQKYNHKELHVHHTWQPEHKHFNGSNGIQLQINMRDFHINTNGWSDIGQHVTLLPDGTFVTGRDFGKTPASIKGYNTGAFACEMLGNFDKGHDVLQGKQKESILRLARFFDDRGKYIRFHRENSPKTCPGTSIDKAQFMKEVKALGTSTAPKVTQPVINKCKIEIGSKVIAANGILENGHSYLPVRAVGDATGDTVGFCKDSGKAIIASHVLDTTKIIGGTGYAMTREIAEAIDYKYAWDGKTTTVKLMEDTEYAD